MRMQVGEPVARTSSKRDRRRIDGSRGMHGIQTHRRVTACCGPRRKYRSADSYSGAISVDCDLYVLVPWVRRSSYAI